MRMIKYLLVILSVISLGCSQLFAGNSSDSTSWDSVSALATIRLFCDQGYISPTSGIGNIEPLMFEADIIPYYVIGFNGSRRWAVGLSPRVLLRMFDDESYPVRTPSFIPRVMFIHQVLNKKKRRDWFYYLSWYHHSNGQEGNFYNPDSVTVNTRTGDFYTNWVDAGFFFSRLRGKERYYLKFNAEYCYKQNKELDSRYGRARFWFNLQNEWNLSRAFKPILTLYFDDKNIIILNNLKVGYIGGYMKSTAPLCHKRFVFSYTVSFKPPYFRDITVFAQYYHGQDYYNINFMRMLDVFRFGIAAKTSVFQ